MENMSAFVVMVCNEAPPGSVGASALLLCTTCSARDSAIEWHAQRSGAPSSQPTQEVVTWLNAMVTGSHAVPHPFSRSQCKCCTVCRPSPTTHLPCLQACLQCARTWSISKGMGFRVRSAPRPSAPRARPTQRCPACSATATARSCWRTAPPCPHRLQAHTSLKAAAPCGHRDLYLCHQYSIVTLNSQLKCSTDRQASSCSMPD